MHLFASIFDFLQPLEKQRYVWKVIIYFIIIIIFKHILQQPGVSYKAQGYCEWPDVNGSVFQLEEPEQMKREVVSNDESAGGLPVCKATLSKNYSIFF